MSSTTMRALIFGGTGNVGKHILNELIKPTYKNRITATVAGRAASLKEKASDVDRWKSGGINFLDVDLANDTEQTISDKIKHTNQSYDVLLSLVGSKLKDDGQKKLIKVAQQCDIKWFIPSEMGYKYEVIGRKSPASWFDVNIDIRDLLRSSGLQYTFIETGFLTEYFLTKSTGIDMEKKQINAAGSKQNLLTTTTLQDTAVYVVNMLLNKETAINKEVLYYSDTLSYEDIAKILSEHTSSEFTVNENSMEALKEKAEKADKSDAASYAFQQVIAGQHGTYWKPEETWNHQNLKDHKPTSLKEWLVANKKQ